MLTGARCAHLPVKVILNSFFIAEPFDSDRLNREAAIKAALQGFEVQIADQDAMNIALTCKICKQIKSSQFGVVDLTGLNRNVLIELGVLFGLSKPVVLLVKKTDGITIDIPTDIVGIEQIRYGAFDELTSGLKSELKNLLSLWKKKGEYILSLKPLLESYLFEVELAANTKKLLAADFKCSIVSFTIFGGNFLAVINKGADDNIKKFMVFNVDIPKQIAGTQQSIEESIGQLFVVSVQPKIALAVPISHDPSLGFWVNGLNATILPPNNVRPHLHEFYVDKSEDDLNRITEVLRTIIRNIAVR